MKTYSYAVDWARVKDGRQRISWHNDPNGGGTFECAEDVNKIMENVLKVLRKYSTCAYEWNHAATCVCEEREDGRWADVCRDIEVAAWAPCDCSMGKGNMVRVRAIEDWNSWFDRAMR